MTTPPDTPNPENKKDGWIERLADRSSGLEKNVTPAAPTPSTEQTESARLWRLGGLGVQFAGTVALFWFLGRQLDRYMGWNNRATLSLIVIAIVGSLYLLIKEAIKANRDQ